MKNTSILCFLALALVHIAQASTELPVMITAEATKDTGQSIRTPATANKAQ